MSIMSFWASCPRHISTRLTRKANVSIFPDFFDTSSQRVDSVDTSNSLDLCGQSVTIRLRYHGFEIQKADS
jgi:hypothetical protein